MQRKSQNIEVKFGSQGSAELKRDLTSIAGTLTKVKGAGISMFDALKVGAGVDLFNGAFTAALGSLDLTADQYVDSIARLSNVTGTSLEEMSRLAGVARRFGVDIDDLRGSMIQFFGQAGAGAKGDAIAEEFQKLGISSQFLADNLDDPLKILLAVAKAQKSLTGATRTGVLSVLFGEDDSAKVGELLNALGSDAAGVADAIGEIDASGAVVTAEDVRVTREFAAAMAEFDDTFRGLRLELARGILPSISKLTGATADWLRENREVASGAILGGWKRIGYVIQDVIDYMKGGRNAVRDSWLYPVTGWLEGIGNAGGTATRIMGELADELSGTRTTREFKWIDGLASGLKTIGSVSAGAIDAAFGIIGGTATASLELLNQLPGALEFVGNAFGEFQQGFSGTVTGSALAETGALMGDLVGYSLDLKDAIADIAAGKPVDAQFEWLKQLIDSTPDLISSIRELGSVGEILRGVGESFDTILALAVPIGTAGAVFLATFGGLGVAIGGAAIALGVFIAKMAEAHDWLKAPFDGADWFFREISGINAAEQQTFDAHRAANDASYEAYLKLRPDTDSLDLAPVQQELDASAPVEIPATFNVEDIASAVEQAQLELSGAVAMARFPDQITSATNAGDAAVRRAGQTLPKPEPTGIPIIIQLMPGGQETVVYAPDEDTAQRLLDSVANARRASATPGGLPFAGPPK